MPATNDSFNKVTSILLFIRHFEKMRRYKNYLRDEDAMVPRTSQWRSEQNIEEFGRPEHHSVGLFGEVNIVSATESDSNPSVDTGMVNIIFLLS